MNANSAVEVALLILIVFLAGALIGYLLRRWLRPEKPGPSEQTTRASPSRIADATAGAASAAGATPIAQMASDPGSESSDADEDEDDKVESAIPEAPVEPEPITAPSEVTPATPVVAAETPPPVLAETGDAGSGRPAALDAPRNGTKDDLRKIKGIGPKIEGTLNGLGIYHYDQIAAWDRENVAWIDEHLSFKGRIDREEWIAQAKALADRD